MPPQDNLPPDSDQPENAFDLPGQTSDPDWAEPVAESAALQNPSEPSVLDWLISVLDPRRSALTIPPDPETVRQMPWDELDPGLESVQEPRATAETPLSTPQVDPAVPISALAAEAPGLTEPETSQEFAEPFTEFAQFPWRSLAALVFAFIGQSQFEPPRDSSQWMTGAAYWAIAILILIWATLSGEWRPTRLPKQRPARDPQSVRKLALAVGIYLTLWAYYSMGTNPFTHLGENHLSGWDVFFWVSALLALGYGFWIYRPGTLAKLKRVGPWLRQPRLELRITPWGLLLAAGLAVVIFFRFSSLSSVPPEMFSDHAEKLMDIQDVLDGETRIFFPRNTGREAFQMYLTAAVIKYVGTGVSFLSLKIGTASMGVFTLIFIYLLGVELGGRRLGFFSAFLAGIAYWPNVISRVALRFTLFPAFAAPTLYFLVRGLRRGNRNDFILSGIFLGIGLHGYSPFRFVPLLVLVAFGLFVLHRLKYRPMRQVVLHLGVLVAFSLVIFMPLIRFALENEANAHILTYRGLTRLTDAERPLPGPASQIFIENTAKALIMMAWDNGETWVHSVTHRPVLDIVGAVLYYFGVVLLIIRYAARRDWEDAFLLISVPLLMLPSILSLAFPAENPSLNRTAGAIIPVFIMMGMALDGLLSAFEKRIGLLWGRRWGWALVGLLLIVSMQANYRYVFEDYFIQFEGSSWNTSEIGTIIRNFADTIGTEESAWVVPWPHWVDTRLVGINAGVPRKDYALSRDRLQESQSVFGTKMFILNKDDTESLDILLSLYPGGSFSRYVSDVESKDFLVFIAPASDYQGPESGESDVAPDLDEAYPLPVFEIEEEPYPYPYPYP